MLWICSISSSILHSVKNTATVIGFNYFHFCMMSVALDQSCAMVKMVLHKYKSTTPDLRGNKTRQFFKEKVCST